MKCGYVCGVGIDFAGLDDVLATVYRRLNYHHPR